MTPTPSHSLSCISQHLSTHGVSSVSCCSANCWAEPCKPTKPVACPASRLKKQPRVNNRDISGLMNQGAHTSEVRSWSNTPPCAAEYGSSLDSQGWNWGQVGSWVTRETTEGHAPHSPFDKNNHQLGPRASRMVSCEHRVQVKQELVGQGMCREQENSHLEGLTIHSPLQTLHNPYNLCLPLFSDISGVRYVECTATRYHRYDTHSHCGFQ